MMRLYFKRFIATGIASLTVCALTSVAVAQSTRAPNTLESRSTFDQASAGAATPTTGLGRMLAPAPPASYGIKDFSGTWVTASKFQAKDSPSAPQLAHYSNQFYNAPGMTSPTRYYAQIDLEQGVRIEEVSCLYEDNSAVNDVSVGLHVYSFTATPPSRSHIELEQFSSSGTPGLTSENLTIDPPETFRVINPDGNSANHYYLSADIADDTNFGGCIVWWWRQVSPPPSVASFSDVPTTHPFFAEIEALASSGISTGYADGTFKPSSFVTRQAMAAFLARALGLHWPN
jgi:hypothetical protein